MKHVAITFCAVVSMCAAQTSATFEQWHDRGLKRNPSGVSLHIETRDNRAIYHTSETINLLMVFTSERENLYSAVATDPGSGDDVVLQRVGEEAHRLIFDHGIVCCSSSAPKDLGRKPVEVPSYFYFRLPEGQYSLFVETKRVLQGHPEGAYGKGPTVTSDILHLTVLPEEKPAVRH